MDELEYINNRLRDYMNQIADHISTGSCENMEDYRFCCGQIQGFALIEREIIELREKVEKLNSWPDIIQLYAEMR